MNSYSQICDQSVANAKYLVIGFLCTTDSYLYFFSPLSSFIFLSCDSVVVSISLIHFFGGDGSIKSNIWVHVTVYFPSSRP